MSSADWLMRSTRLCGDVSNRRERPAISGFAAMGGIARIDTQSLACGQQAGNDGREAAPDPGFPKIIFGREGPVRLPRGPGVE